MVDALVTARFGIRLLQSQFESHHPIHPDLRPRFERGQNRRGLLVRQTVGFQNLDHLMAFVVGALDDFHLLAPALALVMFGVALRGQIAAQPHGDRACGDFRQPGHDDHVGGSHRAGESRGQREGHREAVGHSDDDIAHRQRRFEVFFNVLSLRHYSAAFIAASKYLPV